MKGDLVRRGTQILVWAMLASFAAARALAQPSLFDDPATLSAGGDPGADVIRFSAHFSPPDSSGVSVLYLSAKIKEGWHIYSVTQPKGGPIATKIALTAPESLVGGPIRVWPKPVTKKEQAFGDLPIESHSGDVLWYLPVRLPAGANPADFKIEGKLTIQACNDQGCLPPKSHKFVAPLGKPVELPKESDPVPPLEEKKPNGSQAARPLDGEVGSIRQPGSHTTITGKIEPQVAAPGETIRLTLTASPDAAYHVYALEPADSGKGIYKPTLISLAETSGLTASPPAPDREPTVKTLAVSEGESEEQRYYEQPVTWTIELKVPADAAPGTYRVAGAMGYQSCYAGGCDRPLGTSFAVDVPVASASVPGETPLVFSKLSYKNVQPSSSTEKGAPESTDVAVTSSEPTDAAPAAAPLDLEFEELVIEGDAELSQMPLAVVMLFAFAGGLILNLMPCVLPVIGLKVLSFVEQSHHSRARVLALNIWYALGMMLIFLLLATLAAFAGFGWGELFKYSWFNIALAGVVFTMSLSFLGVWEIPIPGFAGTGKAAELAAQEGAAGAFAKGAITTILATPCTGPFLTTALVWAVAKPAPVVYAVFASIGLGMASPYLLIGAFPGLVRWLPKPGAWMETFKQLMGFVLLATLVYLLTLVPWASLVPTIALLFGLWGACWWIGRHQWSTKEHSKLWYWGQSLAFAAVVGAFSFTWLQNLMNYRFEQAFENRIAQAMASDAPLVAATKNENHIQWKPFTVQGFKQLVDQNQTVMVDFTAPWCLTCQVLEAQVLNSPSVRELLNRNDVVPMQAQWVDEYPETGLMLEKLKSEQIPVVAIFPAGRWNRPIVLRGVYAPQTLVTALEKAGPSQASTTVATAQAPASR